MFVGIEHVFCTLLSFDTRRFLKKAPPRFRIDQKDEQNTGSSHDENNLN
jgi:hypothetical protein